jgi:hypothetical protein
MFWQFYFSDEKRSLKPNLDAAKSYLHDTREKIIINLQEANEFIFL